MSHLVASLLPIIEKLPIKSNWINKRTNGKSMKDVFRGTVNWIHLRNARIAFKNLPSVSPPSTIRSRSYVLNLFRSSKSGGGYLTQLYFDIFWAMGIVPSFYHSFHVERGDLLSYSIVRCENSPKIHAFRSLVGMKSTFLQRGHSVRITTAFASKHLRKMLSFWYTQRIPVPFSSHELSEKLLANKTGDMLWDHKRLSRLRSAKATPEPALMKRFIHTR